MVSSQPIPRNLSRHLPYLLGQLHNALAGCLETHTESPDPSLGLLALPLQTRPLVEPLPVGLLFDGVVPAHGIQTHQS